MDIHECCYIDQSDSSDQMTCACCDMEKKKFFVRSCCWPRCPQTSWKLKLSKDETGRDHYFQNIVTKQR